MDTVIDNCLKLFQFSGLEKINQRISNLINVLTIMNSTNGEVFRKLCSKFSSVR